MSSTLDPTPTSGPADDPPGQGDNIVAAIEPAEPAGDGAVEEEDEFLAQGWDSTSSVGSTSVASSIMRGEYVQGRRYHSYRAGKYPMPNDDMEQEREDMLHYLMKMVAVGCSRTRPARFELNANRPGN